MRIGMLILLSLMAISLAGHDGPAQAATKQICTTDPYGTRTCTDSRDTTATKAPRRVKKKAAK